MNRVRRQIGWSRELYESCKGESIHVAVLDTGIAPHPDLIDSIETFVDLRSRRTLMYDDSGHGTHVAGCIAGNGFASGGKYCGICPGCKLIGVKILDQNGDGDMIHLLNGLYWVIEHRVIEKIKIVNISVGINSGKMERNLEEIKVILDTLWDQGVVVVCAAGNLGPSYGSVSPLADGKSVIAVGCHEGGALGYGKNLCERYSGRGRLGGELIKPDLVAPGTNIVSCNNDFIEEKGGIREGYTVKSGTSMSAPVVTGAIALLLKKYPYLTNEQIRKRLLASTRQVSRDRQLQGYGMIDLRKLLY